MNTDQKNHKFFVELTSLVNRYSMDSKADTPDYVLAEYMIDCLKTFCSSLENRMAHVYGKAPSPTSIHPEEPEGQEEKKTWTESEVEALVEYLIPGMNSMVLISDFREATRKK